MTNTTDTAATVNAAIATELERLATLPRTEFVGRVVTLEISKDIVRVFDQHPNVDGVGMDVWHGLTRVIGLPGGIIPSVAAQWVADNSALITRVQSGLSREWDGSNHVGRLSYDAREAQGALESAADMMAQDAHAMWARRQIIDPIDASEYYGDYGSEIAAAESAEGAIQLALESLDDDGVADFGDGLVYLDPEEAAQYARSLWEEQNAEE